MLSAVAAMGLFTACDPVCEDGSLSYSLANADELLERITFVQRDAEGNLAEDGNYVSFQTNPATTVSIFVVDKEGNEKVLASGAAGEFLLAAGRGADPRQAFKIRAVAADNSESVADTALTVYVQADLAPEMKLLVGNGVAPTSKAWTWYFGYNNAEGGACWGNMGGNGSGGHSISGNAWWGVNDAAQLTGQMKHSVTGVAIGEEDNDAYMVFNEDGSVVCYDKDANQIRKGTFEISDYNPDSDWSLATLTTSEGATLFPYEINAGGKYVTKFEVHELSEDLLVLAYPDGGEWPTNGDWKEATYWCFQSVERKYNDIVDVQGSAASGAWTWDFDYIGKCWGNFGFTGDSFSELGGLVWWGVENAADLAGQMGHSVTGEPTGEENNAATMIFSRGRVTCFDAQGNSIRTGDYSFDPSIHTAWQRGTLRTSEGATLFPFEINAGGRYVTEYQIHTITPNRLILTYPDNGAFDGWSEGTYWCFKR